MRSLSGRPVWGRNPLFLAAFALLVACAGGGGGGEEAGPAPSLPPECTSVRSPAILGANHIPNGQRGTYNTTPPTSGEHYASPVPVAIYRVRILDEQQVHNLEHGHVLIQYRDLADDQVARLEALAQSEGKKVLVAPYPDMDPRLAVTAWGKIQTCDAWVGNSTALVQYFIRTHRDNAPESID